MRSFKKSEKGRGSYKERSQPASRAGLGLLEKKSDYRSRAKDYNRKKKQLRNLQEKAYLRNKDEFSTKMIKSKTKDGVHEKTTQGGRSYSQEEIQLLKTQDLKYLQMKSNLDGKKIEKLHSTLHLSVQSEEKGKKKKREEGEGPRKKKDPKHIVFVDDEEEVANFEPEEYFDTLPQFVNRTENRPRKDQLKAPLIVNSKSIVGDKFDSKNTDPSEIARSLKYATERVDAGVKRRYKELEQREERKKKLDELSSEVQLQRNLMGKGKRRKITKKDGTVVYKWERERKR